jgi:hypothetical protein
MLHELHRHRRKPSQPETRRDTITWLPVHPADRALLVGDERSWMDQEASPGLLKRGLHGESRGATIVERDHSEL